ncbi:hypothetical protein GCM10012285_07260 [Streptomyces kronopolitis]|uniref:Cytochrome oxidase subunit I profile domain-containing protein n=1 Tax=Streptomyces kronopolitis TaxID=1612435 RepID=A0ABQ2IYB5_9ACTN|nr:hypothetical protein GCM10012285_07260 [Streptomyces kronopolitis]
MPPVLALPFFGIVSEVLPVFARKPMFGYLGLIAATISIAGLSVTVWAHHMYVTGGVLLPFVAFMTFLIAVPTGVKFFNWIGTMWRGSLSCDTLFGTVVYAMFAGFPFWWPKFTGKMLDERLGRITFWTLTIGFHLTFLVQHWLGAAGTRTISPPTASPPQRPFHDRLLPPRPLLSAVLLQRLEDRPIRHRGRLRRPLGLWPLPGMGHLLPAAAPQLHFAAPHSQ